MKKCIIMIFVALALCTLNPATYAQEKPAQAGTDPAELAKKLSNPVASLISVPFQNNTDVGIGSFNGYKNTTNFQPVIPISLGSKWNLISRFIIPIVGQQNITGEGTSQFGLSDAVVSAFFSPAEAKNGLIWGAGPVLLVPIATDESLGTQKLGIGPTALILKQTQGFTIGLLASQMWSVAGSSDRTDVNQMFLQPFMAYNWKSGAGLALASEITQNWEPSTTIVWVNPSVTGITKLGKQTIQLQVGPRIQVAAPDGNKADFGMRGSLIFVFPK